MAEANFTVMLIRADVRTPPPEGETFAERWEGPDGGLVTCWLTGLAKRRDSSSDSPWPGIVTAAERGELPILPWQGGVERPAKGVKVGALQYLAMWQGLRADDLHVDTGGEPAIVCARHGVRVVFTGDLKRLG